MNETTHPLPNKQKPDNKQKPGKPRLAPLLIVAALVLLIGAAVIVSKHTTAPDPTLTRALPPGPHAVTLYPSAAKLAHGGHLHRLRQPFLLMRKPNAPKLP